MNDERYEYFKDQASKSITAKSSHAKYKRQNTFNNYSRSEANKKNGECVTYNLGKPMFWREFKALPENYQKQYLQNLFDHLVSIPEIAKMFRVSATTVKLAKQALDIKVTTKAGGHMPLDAYGWWNEFLAKEDTVVNPISDEFVSWDKFKSFSNDIQQAYIQSIIDKYHVGLETISVFLFKMSKGTLHSHLKKHGLDINQSSVSNRGSRGRKYAEEFKKVVEAALNSAEMEEPEPMVINELDDIPPEKYESASDKEKTIDISNSSAVQRVDFWMDEFDFKFINLIAEQFAGRKVTIHIDICEIRNDKIY